MKWNHSETSKTINMEVLGKFSWHATYIGFCNSNHIRRMWRIASTKRTWLVAAYGKFKKYHGKCLERSAYIMMPKTKQQLLNSIEDTYAMKDQKVYITNKKSFHLWYLQQHQLHYHKEIHFLLAYIGKIKEYTISFGTAFACFWHWFFHREYGPVSLNGSNWKPRTLTLTSSMI